MRCDWTHRLLLGTALTLCGSGPAGLAASTRDTDYGPAVRRAVALLPTRPAQVLVLDVNDAKPEDRDYLSRLQAFVLKGSPVIYLTRHGEVLREAAKGSRFHEYMLATVIWHEMAHAEGADESQARRREEELWTRFMLENAIDRDAALNYLVLLKKRTPIGVQ